MWHAKYHRSFSTYLWNNSCFIQYETLWSLSWDQQSYTAKESEIQYTWHLFAETTCTVPLNGSASELPANHSTRFGNISYTIFCQLILKEMEAVLSKKWILASNINITLGGIRGQGKKWCVWKKWLRCRQPTVRSQLRELYKYKRTYVKRTHDNLLSALQTSQSRFWSVVRRVDKKRNRRIPLQVIHDDQVISSCRMF